MDLEIRYENGSMTVHLEEFLNVRSIAKVRKLCATHIRSRDFYKKVLENIT